MQNSTFKPATDQKTNKKAMKKEKKEDFVEKPDSVGWPNVTDKALVSKPPWLQLGWSLAISDSISTQQVFNECLLHV